MGHPDLIRRRRAGALLTALLGLGGAVAWPASAERPLPSNGLGFSLPPTALDGVPSDGSPWSALPEIAGGADPEAPLYVRLVVPARLLESPGLLARLDAALRPRSLVPILVFDPPGTGQRVERPDFDIEDWASRVDGFLSGADETPLLVEILDRPSERVDPRLYAYLVKRLAVVVRAAAPRAVVGTGPISEPGDLEILAEAGLAPYLDAVAVHASLPLADAIAAGRQIVPAGQIWIDATGAGGTPFLAPALEGLSQAASLVVTAPDSGVPLAELAGWRRHLGPGASVIAAAWRRVRARDVAGVELPAGRVVEFETAAGVRHVAVLDAAGPLTLTVGGPMVAAAISVDPLSGREIGGWSAAPAPEGGVRIGVHAPAEGGVALYRLGLAVPMPSGDEATVVAARRDLTVEEILARHREYRAAQDRAAANFIAKARIDYHFSLVNLSETFDVATNNLYYSRDGVGRYEELEIFINGARWRGPRPPNLPFIIPERITEVPLDLRLDEHYVYELEGREKVDGREAYVIRFAPLPTDRSLWHGRVWIDAALFCKLRLEGTQINLELPVISNTIRQTFAPVAATVGEWWLMTGVRGQMVFTALGRNIVLEREIGYAEFELDPPDLEARLAAAWSSEHGLLEETADGFRRLDQLPGGGGRVESGGSSLGAGPPSRLFVAGWSVGEGFDPGLPFAGINYFNFDWRGTGTQLDMVWAGPFFSVFWSDPSLRGTPAILALDARINPLPSENQQVEPADGSRDGERLELTQQTLTGLFGFPLGVFHKIELQPDLEVMLFDRADETAPDFTVPQDMVEGSLTLRWVYNRGGLRADAGVEAAARSTWDFWGRPDGSDWSPADQGFTRWSAHINKTFYPRRSDKISTGVALFGGHGLDRFSQFAFGEFSTAGIAGFNGAGIRFDRGAILDLGYAVDLAGSTRLDLFASHARFENRAEYGPGDEHATGVGAALNIAGPWNSLIRVRAAWGVDSSLGDVDGSGGVRFTLFRTFDRWFWQKEGEIPAEPVAEKKSPGLPAETGARWTAGPSGP